MGLCRDRDVGSKDLLHGWGEGGLALRARDGSKCRYLALAKPVHELQVGDLVDALVRASVQSFSMYDGGVP